MKQKILLLFFCFLGGGSLALSVSAWSCANDPYCRQQGLIGILPAPITKALVISFDTTTEGWSGPEQGIIQVAGEEDSVYIPPPPPPRQSH